MNQYDEILEPAKHNDLPIPLEISSDAAKHRAIMFIALICVGKI